MFEKPKNGVPSQRSNLLFVLMVSLAAVVIGGIIGYFARPVETVVIPPPADDLQMTLGDEAVLVPLNSNDPTMTQREYSGVVTLMLTGTGQVSGTDFSDAFYVYMNADRQVIHPSVMQFDFTLEVDGESLYNTLHLNSDILPYSFMHTYLVRYDVGDSLRRISFRTADRGVDDNTGHLQVTIFNNVSWLETVSPFVPTPTPEPVVASEGGEVLNVPFTSGSPVYTQDLYAGTVKLILRGTGQAGGADYSDAFYLYERGDHSPYDPPVLGDFAMELDGGKIHDVIGYSLPYNTDHVYIVTYNVGPEPRRIGFRNTDLSTGDNDGAYTVEVVAGE